MNNSVYIYIYIHVLLLVTYIYIYTHAYMYIMCMILNSVGMIKDARPPGHNSTIATITNDI